MGIDGNGRDDLQPHRVRRPGVAAGRASPRWCSRVVIGTVIGLVAGFYGRRLDNGLMRCMDVLLAFPSLLLAIIIVTVLGRGLVNAVIAISLVTIPIYAARRARPACWRSASRTSSPPTAPSASEPPRLLFHRVFPNTLTPLVVQAHAGHSPRRCSRSPALGFLGLGVQPPGAEWGSMVSDGSRASILSRAAPDALPRPVHHDQRAGLQPPRRLAPRRPRPPQRRPMNDFHPRRTISTSIVAETLHDFAPRESRRPAVSEIFDQPVPDHTVGSGDTVGDELDPTAHAVVAHTLAEAPAELRPLLTVRDLRTWFRTGDGDREGGRRRRPHRRARRGARPRRRVGQRQERDDVLGAAPRRRPRPHRRAAASTSTASTCSACGKSALRSIRGDRISMVFQQPNAVAQPLLPRRCADRRGLRDPPERQQEGRLRQGDRDAAPASASPTPPRRAKSYPHQLSGGMAQRVMIAMALAAEPELLIADEPTTALDVTIQAQILDLMRQLQADSGTSVVLITHDLGVVAEMAHRVAVMYGGQIVEQASANDLFADPKHPYTQGLLGSVPVIGRRQDELTVIPGRVPTLIDPPPGCRFADRCPERHGRVHAGDTGAGRVGARRWAPGALLPAQPGHGRRGRRQRRSATMSEAPRGRSDPEQPVNVLVSARGITKSFPLRGGALGRATGAVHAVDRVDLDVYEGEVLGLVGESGCGKTHPVTHPAAPARPRRGARSRFAGQRPPGGVRRRPAPAAQGHPGRVPGPVLVARPAGDGGRLDRRRVAGPRGRRRRTARNGCAP